VGRRVLGGLEGRVGGEICVLSLWDWCDEPFFLRDEMRRVWDLG